MEEIFDRGLSSRVIPCHDSLMTNNAALQNIASALRAAGFSTARVVRPTGCRRLAIDVLANNDDHALELFIAIRDQDHGHVSVNPRPNRDNAFRLFAI